MYFYNRFNIIQIERSLNNIMSTENKILNYDYTKLMKDFKVKEKIISKNFQTVKKF